MKLFHPQNRHVSDRHAKLWAHTEIAYTIVDFGAALCFVVGSVMFFFETWQTPGTWLFLIGSILFAAKPTIRLWRESRLLALGDPQDVAKKQRG
ncbi:hypothetical protein EKE94_08110 [Mesobaculum littorinae]|uniref:YrhK domain-containing protein n=1 Tax=Mesobaculum littorinae TaxID=2486419 RepID=A0A438AJR6_9RHOB|nr:YrhK family protein [Mesobaculum littorinae]RVV98847.1 hypothetical protein EKE94_08110 [Mesobaculum littorinae]